MTGEQEQAVAQYVETRAPALAASRGIELQEARRVLRSAAEERVLFADFVLHIAPGETVTVGEVLSDPDRWHHRGCLDPLEPEYQPGNYRIGRLDFYHAARPSISSFAHGGRWYFLAAQRREVKVVAGNLPVVCDRALDVVRQSDTELFQTGAGDKDEIVGIVRDAPSAVCDVTLADHLNRHVKFVRAKKTKTETKWIPIDCPGDVAKTINRARRGKWGLRTLRGIVTAPTMRIDGSLATTCGYDQATNLLLLNLAGSDYSVCLDPSIEQVTRAVRWLWAPFRMFPFDSEVSSGVFLSQLFTAVTRPALPTAPGFMNDATASGSGKTLLCKAVGMLASGRMPAMQVWPTDSNEVPKALFSSLRKGSRVVVWDNCQGVLRSKDLTSVLTAERYEGRVLASIST